MLVSIAFRAVECLALLQLCVLVFDLLLVVFKRLVLFYERVAAALDFSMRSHTEAKRFGISTR